MKKIILMMVALLSMTAMMAQTNNGERKAPKKMTHEEMTSQMNSKLKLSSDQKTKVAALNKEYQDYLMPEPPQKPEGDKDSNSKKQKDSKKSASKKPDQKPSTNGQNQAKRQEYDKKLKQILTDDQYKNYQKMQPQCDGSAQKDKQKKSQKSKKQKK
ncbi:MAG: DUF4890 domain-containing protein [Prevotella sp.]|nr:DUF4890 domain-containing protein [Prevotella sp.]